LAEYKQFLDSQCIKLPTGDFMAYLELYLQPMYLRDLVNEKYMNLEDQREKLRAMLSEDVKEIEENVAYFEETLLKYQDCTLKSPKELL
jgi:hypothetical protein